MKVLVIYSDYPSLMAIMFQAFGLDPKLTRHDGTGPEHWVVQARDGTVIEAYPASPDHPHGTWRYLR